LRERAPGALASQLTTQARTSSAARFRGKNAVALAR
jgi:hypothetical protein